MTDVLQDNSALLEFARAVQADNIQGFIQAQTEESVVALPEGVKVHDLEKYLANRRHFRGTMETCLIEEFVEYSTAATESYAEAFANSDNTPCFVNPQSMSAVVFFNLGDIDAPGHGDHQARLALLKTEAFKELLSINGKRFEQRELAEWMEDWKDQLTARAENGETELPMASAVAAIRRITIGANAETISEQQNFSSRRSAMAEVEAKFKDQIPAFLDFKCEPYQGLDERTFNIRLSLITGETPKLAARIVRLESAQEEMAKELETKLRKGFEDTPVRTFVGKFDHH